MIFTANRKNKYDIYEVDVATGKEKQLTDTPTLNDGSEYSPDNKFIYFNSNRTGTMQLWKMKANGKDQTQLTFDKYNDWFAHFSPDGKSIVFISFPEDIDTSTHPFYKHCLIRMMPIEGGEPKVIAYVYGGQGTINVPSWSPDSKYIAFVSNTNDAN
jgi:Tol biopolymer transport system component